MKKLIVAIMCMFLAGAAPAATITVDDGSWADFDNIQAAIDSARNGDVIVVYPGTYTGQGNRDIDFLGKSVTVRSTDPDDPDTVNATVIDCQNSSRAFYFHRAEGHDSVLAGLTITGGRIYGADPKGGAICCSGASPAIQNCIITGNTVAGAADESAKGGAIYIESDSSPLIVGCTISKNSSLAGDGHSDSSGYGTHGRSAFAGAVYCGIGSSVTIVDCEIADNLAAGGDAGYSSLWAAEGGDSFGGAIYVDPGAQLTIINSTIRNNKAYRGEGQGRNTGHDGYARGGAISCAGQSSAFIDNCLLTNNIALSGKRACRMTGSGWACSGGEAYGGAIDLHNTAMASVTNCTIADNSVRSDAGATYGAGISCGYSAEVAIENSIVWGNTGAEQLAGNLVAAYSDIEGGFTGQTNINSDPGFIDPGYWDANGTTGDPSDDFWVDGDYHLPPGSACIDAGDPDFPDDSSRNDLDGEPRIATGRIDIGADELTTKHADLTVDGIINFEDLSRLIGSFASSPGDPDWNGLCDLREDGRIDLGDVSELIGNWLWRASWHE